MPVTLTFGDPYWRDLGFREAKVEIPVDRRADGLAFEELLSLLPGAADVGGYGELLTLLGSGDEWGPAVFLNGHHIPPGRLGHIRLSDGDQVVVQAMLAGG